MSTIVSKVTFEREIKGERIETVIEIDTSGQYKDCFITQTNNNLPNPNSTSAIQLQGGEEKLIISAKGVTIELQHDQAVMLLDFLTTALK